ncbi:MAG TPA: 3-hydroxyacyl-CoA dehydrogenase family protein [Terriglobia bacterium]|nr:3-hydroxyacyl-CoA dehydrogenase family protein [Terriglobia bacterium]
MAKVMQASRIGRPVKTQRSECMRAGVVGLGLMGKSIVACLLSSGATVIGLDVDAKARRRTRQQVLAMLKEMKREGLLKANPAELVRRLAVTTDFARFSDCEVVIESITEDSRAKRETFAKIENVVSAGTLLASNTSAIPISSLQEGCRHPERVIGMHWAEPSHVTRFMEIICGDSTSAESAERAAKMAQQWGKEPALVRKDVRGFIANRISYAMFREAFHLVESGVATVEDVDRSLRNDVGFWITFAGPFRYMDLTGVQAYKLVMKDLLPDLDCSKAVPDLMRKVADSGGNGVSTRSGFYRYTPRQAKRWQELFLKFNYDIRKLAMKYPVDAGDRPAPKRRKRSGR